MAGEKNFNIKNGLSVAGVEVINSSGDLVAGGVGTAVQEAIADKIGGILSATGGATATYNDGADTIVIDVPITDEDNMSSNSATAIPSQQSVKAYVDSQILTKDNTDEITEGSSNLYFTNTRADARFDVKIAAADTGDLSEGSNLYYTNTRADARITNALVDEDNMASNSDVKIPSQQSVKAYVDAQVASKDALSELSGDTDDITEGSSNLYYTDARAQAVSINNVVEDTTPQLGANLDGQSFNITTTGKMLYSNVYSAEGDLPSASTYHGMFAHVHGTGKGYFAHGGNWIKLLDETSSTTANLTENTNLYYTDERVDDRVNALIVGGTNVTATYDDAGDGAVDLAITDATIRGKVSVTDAGGDGSLAYNNSTGVITYTGPSAAETRAHLSAGTGVGFSSGAISIGQAVATTSDVQFADVSASGNLVVTGNLTVNGSTVTNSSTNTTIEDSLIELGTGTTGSPSGDAGIVIERGDESNVFMGWDDSASSFAFGTTTATGASTGALSVTPAAVSTGALTITNASNSGGTARNVYQSTSAPGGSDGAVGDMWILYS